MQERSARRPGLRFSVIDGLALVIAVAAVTYAANFAWWLAVGIAFVVAHFFLFCNVFRIARSLELAWAAVFVLLVCGTVLTETPSWPWTFGISFAMTVIVIGLQMRRPTYHGLAWQWINPSLADRPPTENAKGVAASSGATVPQAVPPRRGHSNVNSTQAG